MPTYQTQAGSPFCALHLPITTFVGCTLVRAIGGVWTMYLLLKALTLLVWVVPAEQTAATPFLFGVRTPQ